MKQHHILARCYRTDNKDRKYLYKEETVSKLQELLALRELVAGAEDNTEAEVYGQVLDAKIAALRLTTSYVEKLAPTMKELGLWRITITATPGKVEEVVLGEDGEPVINMVESLELTDASFAASDIRSKPPGRRKTNKGERIVNGITMTSDIVKNRVYDGRMFVNASDLCDYLVLDHVGQSAVLVLAKNGKDWKSLPSVADGVSI